MRPLVSTSFMIVGADDEPIGPFKFTSHLAASDHAGQLLCCGEAGPLYVVDVVEVTERRVGPRYRVRKPLFRPALADLRGGRAR